MAVREILAGKAVVEIGLRNRIEAGLKSIQTRLKSFGAGVRTLGTGIAAGGGMLTGFAAGAIAPILGAAKAFASLGDTLDKTAARTGVSAEALSEMRFAAQQSGADLPQVEKGIFGLSRAMFDASRGGKEANAALEQIGLTYQDLAGLSPEQQFQKVADGLAAIEDLSMRGAVAQKLMGRSGRELLPMLGTLRELRAEARELGVTMSEDDSKSAAVLTDALNRVTRTLESVVMRVGAAVAPAFAAAADVIASVVSGVSAWIDKNRYLFVAISAVIVGLGTLGAVLTAVGLSLALMGAAISAIASVAGTVLAAAFSPLGAVVAILLGAAGAAYYFRDSILKLLSPLAPIFSGLRDLVGNFGAIFGQTFSAIVGALGSGNLEAAGALAMAGLSAAFWQGVADIGGVVTTLLDMLTAWLPGLDTVREYAIATFGSIGSALLAGRWDLAGAILMAKLRLAIATGWNSIKFLWTSFTIGLATVFESMASGIRSAWRSVVFKIAEWITWIGEKLGLVTAGASAELEKMRAAAQAADDKNVAKRDRARYADAQAQLDAANAATQSLKDKIAGLEAEASKAQEDSGITSIADKAAAARQALADAIAKASEPKPENPKLNELAAASAGGEEKTRKLASSGTFSATAAALFGLNSDNQPAKDTAQHTKQMVGLLKRLAKQRADQAFT